jgi:hypothetical protein
MNASAVDEMPPLRPTTDVPSVPAPARSEPRFGRSIDFAALPTAITCTRLFVASTLQLWGARFLEADAELLAVELVRHSVHACGVMDLGVRLYELDHLNVIHVRLLGFERTIGIEVWDNAEEPARLPEHDQTSEPRGLALVDTRAKDWGSTVTPQGRVVWAELDVYERTAAGLPHRVSRPSKQPKNESDWPAPQYDLDFLGKVRDGLADL